ncbi:hypothetical protein [Cellulomonas dongxiuzhuiae]|uniref:DUF4178 domain-containing protein n=1 Tax=Cellulomonas dongxiuzhuiae TaxID=2819979 RepID=A0ABX8GKV9_9CELL|nr:hypothetical protein [Cellulomonas dongxiuzhuiae]MBO3095619.1 hypothetical protein [Cellulomonas dongxiuzhuiae]QWC16585.1 hypothetical protein KKR89_02650 [Cellulomonas dongxiuzhuiae]
MEQVGDEKVLYVGRWNVTLRQPIPGFGWLRPEEAALRYAYKQGDLTLADRAKGDLAVVDGTRDAEGQLRPRWVIGVGHTGVRVRFFTPGGGSIWRSTDYDAREGRLWRWITTEYVYPDDDTFHRQSESTHKYTAKFEPDGTGFVEFTDRSKPTVDVARMTEAPVSGFWMDWPQFGQWDLLADPDYGLPPGGMPGR